MTTEVCRRTFEAKQHPKGSDERKRLNEDARTSEYMPSYRYTVIKDGRSVGSFTTKAAAERAAEVWAA